MSTGYNRYTPHPNDPGVPMSVEEEFIWEVMHTDFKVVKDINVWCSIEDLYRYYKGKWNARLDPYPGEEDPELLHRSVFGASLNAVFPNMIVVDRMINKKRYRGRARLEGPISRQIGKAGRPPRGQVFNLQGDRA